MKKIAYICLLAVVAISACNKKDAIVDKVGIRLPTVTNLALQELGANQIRLSWTNPTSIPSEIIQPLVAVIEIREIRTVMQSLTETVRLENAPTEFTYTVPDPTKSYVFTVKLNGMADVGENPEQRYSTNIYSLGQSVTLN